jgi:hypothetical protein
LVPAYCWVVFYNVFGRGRLASVTQASMLGIRSIQIGSGQVIAAKLTANSQGWTTNIAFTAATYQKVSWGSGTIKTADGTTYSITASDTGLMSALTYIYFDKAQSTTALQTTTTYSNVTGENVILLCVAQNTADTTQLALFIPAVGTLGLNSSSLSANSITTNLLQANSVTAAKISVAQLSAITADCGTLTAGTIIGATIKTASSGSRIEMDSTNGLRSYNGSNVRVQIPVSGGQAGSIMVSPGFGMYDSNSNASFVVGDANGANPQRAAIYGNNGTLVAVHGTDLLQFYIAADSALKTVTTGGTDSGGVGFKYLRVPN